MVALLLEGHDCEVAIGHADGTHDCKTWEKLQFNAIDIEIEIYDFVHNKMDLFPGNSNGKQSQEDHLEWDQEEADER